MRPTNKIRPQVPAAEVNYGTLCFSIIGVRSDNGREEWLEDFYGKPADHLELKERTLRKLKEFLDSGILDSMSYQELVIREYRKMKKNWSKGMVVWCDKKWLIWSLE